MSESATVDVSHGIRNNQVPSESSTVAEGFKTYFGYGVSRSVVSNSFRNYKYPCSCRAIHVAGHGYGNSIAIDGIVEFAYSEGKNIRHANCTQQQDKQDGAHRPFQL